MLLTYGLPEGYNPQTRLALDYLNSLPYTEAVPLEPTAKACSSTVGAFVVQDGKFKKRKHFVRIGKTNLEDAGVTIPPVFEHAGVHAGFLPIPEASLSNEEILRRFRMALFEMNRRCRRLMYWHLTDKNVSRRHPQISSRQPI